MAEQHIPKIGGEPGAYHGFASERLLALLKRARSAGAAPKAFTGCVSEISSCEQVDHDYTDALKEYGAVYEAAQAYLAPGEAVAHDYTLIVDYAEGVQASQLTALIEWQQTAQEIAPVVSDDEVERCGYLGWLRH